MLWGVCYTFKTMSLIEPVIRPPSEANSFLLQVTMGCSQNSCTFCGAYLNKPFALKPQAEIFKDIHDQAKYAPDTSRVFLCDGDALVLGNDKLVPILKELNRSFPKLTRIASYANARNILNKTPDELKELAALKLKLLYLGLESGSDQILARVRKANSAAEAVQAVQKAAQAGLKSHVIVLLGLGGDKAISAEHALLSAKAVSEMDPRYVSLLSVMLVPGTELYAKALRGEFVELNAQELLTETKLFLENVKVSNSLFFCNHASNYLPLDGRLPHDQTKLISIIDSALRNKLPLKPDMLRAL